MFRISPIPEEYFGDPAMVNDFDGNPGSSPARLYEECRSVFEPRHEELTYVCTDEELKKLCRRIHVEIDMSKFNVLDHFYHIFKKRGSLENRTKESTLRLLMKAYRHYKNDSRHVYSDQEIEEILQEEKKLRKAENVRWLKRQQEKPAQRASNDSEGSVVEVINKELPPTESVPEMPEYFQHFFDAVRAMGVDKRLLDSQNSDTESHITPVDINNSLAQLQSECSGVNSAVDNIGTDDFENSIVITQPNEDVDTNSNLVDYQVFNTGKPVSSTQDTINNNKHP